MTKMKSNNIRTKTKEIRDEGRCLIEVVRMEGKKELLVLLTK